MSHPTLEELRASMRPLVLPMRVGFRGLKEREVVLVEGPRGLAEWSPFTEYDDEEAARWLRCTLEQGWGQSLIPQPPEGSTIVVNGTLGAIPASDVESAIADLGHPRTIKVKVAGPLSSVADDVERVSEVRRVLGPEGRIRIDANGLWNVDQAEHAIRLMEHVDIEYVEQPVEDLSGMAELRRRIESLGIQVAADESIRRWADVDAVVEAQACDVVVVKVQPLGGYSTSLKVIEKARSAGLDVVLSSALESSVGVYYQAALHHHLDQSAHLLDAGLGTVAFFTEDPAVSPLVPQGGELSLHAPVLDPEKAQSLAMPADRALWWRERLERCFRLL